MPLPILNIFRIGLLASLALKRAMQWQSHGTRFFALRPDTLEQFSQYKIAVAASESGKKITMANPTSARSSTNCHCLHAKTVMLIALAQELQLKCSTTVSRLPRTTKTDS